jgi:CspA family cold shock protein
MAKGKVKWFNNKKGYGFIIAEDGQSDVFVHYSVIEKNGFKTLKENTEVEYEATQTDKGLKATKVIPPKKETQQQQASATPQSEKK